MILSQDFEEHEQVEVWFKIGSNDENKIIETKNSYWLLSF